MLRARRRKPIDMKLSSKQLGNIGELKTALEFAKLGIPIYFPFGDNESADLLAEFNGKLNRIQVKSTTSNNGSFVTFSLKSSMRGYDHRYTKEEVDYFALYDAIADKLYLIPFTTKQNLSLRITQPKNNQKARILFATDFLIENVLQEKSVKNE